MRPKHFVVLAIAAAVSLLAAIVSYSSASRWTPDAVAGARLFPDLAAEAGQVSRIEIRQGETALTFEKRADGLWGIAERGGFPARTEAVHRLVIELAKAELIEAKTRKLDRHALIEVEEPSLPGAKSRLVRLAGPAGGTIAEAVVGKRRWDAFGSGRSGTYVRRPGELQSWLSNADLSLSSEVKDWIETSVLAMDAAKVRRVTAEIPGEEPLVAERGTGADKTVRFVGFPPAGKTLKDPQAAEQIVQNAAAIQADDVRPLPATPIGPDVSTLRIEADGEPAVQLRLRQDGGEWWLSLTAAGAGGAKSKAGEMMTRLAGWEFKIPGWKADFLLQRRASLAEAGAGKEDKEAK